MEDQQKTAPKPVAALASPASHQILLSSGQRSLLYERIYRRLAGVHAIWMDGTYVKQVSDKKLIQTHEELTFLVKDLAREGEVIAISTTPKVVRNVIERLLREAEELAPEIDVTQAAEENAALVDLCENLLTDLDAVESHQSLHDPRPLGPADRLAQREVVIAVLQALPSGLTADQIIAEKLPYGDCDESELQRALSVNVDLGILQLGSAGVILPSSGLLRINELWEDLCASM